MSDYWRTDKSPYNRSVGCRWCEYDTPTMPTNTAAMVYLWNHVQRAHPDEFAVTVTRPAPPSPGPDRGR